MDGIEELVVHSAVDDVDRAVAMVVRIRTRPPVHTRSRPSTSPTPIIGRQHRNVVVGRVEDARCQDDDGRVSGPVGRQARRP